MFAHLVRITVVIAIVLLSRCVTTYADGRSESTFDDIMNLFHSAPSGAWTFQDVQPRNFMRPDNNPILIAPAPRTTVEYIELKNVPRVLDQGMMPAGPVFAAGYIANSMLHASAMSSYRCSPSFLFRMLNGSEEKAVELPETLRFLKEAGCARTSLVPYDSPEDYGRSPDKLAVRDARNFRIQGFGRVDLTDIDQIRNHLAMGRVVITGIVLPENLVGFRGSLFDEPQGDVMGRQSFALIGYDAKRLRVLLQNSLGKKWGNNGQVWIPLDWYIRLVVDAYVIY